MDARQYASATQRNREYILEVLLQVLPSQSNILEIASGTGEHAVFLAPRLSPRQWIPSDRDPMLLASIESWRSLHPADNLHSPYKIDARDDFWAIEDKYLTIGAIVNINMIHISPWSACLGLLAGASRLLSSGGILYLYGPFKRNGEHSAPSNFAFDESLRAQNREWGVRDLEDVTAEASDKSLNLQAIVQMPANNLSVVFEKV
jgi:hypothetical protein